VRVKDEPVEIEGDLEEIRPPPGELVEVESLAQEDGGQEALPSRDRQG